jgi:putative membrane protein
MKTKHETALLALLLSGVLIGPAISGAANAADDSASGSMTEKAKSAGAATKDAAESAGSAVKSSAESAAGYVSDTAKNAGARVQGKDTAFVRKAAIGGMAEVKSAELAKEKASSSDVKSFAEQMIGDHGKANDELVALAKEKGITVPAELDHEHQTMVQKLEGLSGDAFDKEYLRQQRAGHATMLKLLQDEAKNGKDADLKSFATKTTSVVKEHKSHIEKIGKGGKV